MKVQRARRPYRCAVCLLAIRKGTRYARCRVWRLFGRTDAKVHLGCVAAVERSLGTERVS